MIVTQGVPSPEGGPLPTAQIPACRLGGDRPLLPLTGQGRRHDRRGRLQDRTPAGTLGPPPRRGSSVPASASGSARRRPFPVRPHTVPHTPASATHRDEDTDAAAPRPAASDPPACRPSRDPSRSPSPSVRAPSALAIRTARSAPTALGSPSALCTGRRPHRTEQIERGGADRTVRAEPDGHSAPSSRGTGAIPQRSWRLETGRLPCRASAVAASAALSAACRRSRAPNSRAGAAISESRPGERAYTQCANTTCRLPGAWVVRAARSRRAHYRRPSWLLRSGQSGTCMKTGPVSSRRPAPRAAA